MQLEKLGLECNIKQCYAGANAYAPIRLKCSLSDDLYLLYSTFYYYLPNL